MCVTPLIVKQLFCYSVPKEHTILRNRYCLVAHITQNRLCNYVRHVQSLGACRRVHLTFYIFGLPKLHPNYSDWFSDVHLSDQILLVTFSSKPGWLILCSVYVLTRVRQLYSCDPPTAVSLHTRHKSVASFFFILAAFVCLKLSCNLCNLTRRPSDCIWNIQLLLTFKNRASYI
jgi:hypothetical protein